jgi:predicted esterase
MQLKQLVAILLLGSTYSCFAQDGKPVRYKDLVFTSVTITKDQSYAPGHTKKEKKAHLFDLYEPDKDSVAARPLIIWMHGGGFIFGTKEDKGMKIWSETFAKRGYVCAAISYRLTNHNLLFKFEALTKAAYFAVQDAQAAVGYFKKNCKRYNIDPDKIILGGNSAGGMMALQAAYCSNAKLAKFAGLPDTLSGAKITTLPKVAGVISFWGGIFDLDWLKDARVPIMCVHGSKDGIMPLTNKSAPLYGSLSIHQKADSLKIPNDFRLFAGYSHELQRHFNPIFGVSKATKERWLQAGQYTADFLYTNVINSKLKH